MISGYGSCSGVDSPLQHDLNDLKKDINETGTGDGVNTQRIEHKYGSADGVDNPQKLTSLC